MASSRVDDRDRASRQPRQLAFDLSPEPGLGREDFLVSDSNERAYVTIEAWPDWPDPVLLLVGPPGAGKSHLAALWAVRSRARKVSTEALEEADLEAITSSPLLVEDADRAGRDEKKLFHLVNLVREGGAGLLLTAREPPEGWGIRIPDLLSRLRLAPRVEIGSPDEALVRAVLVKLLVDRQLLVDTRIVSHVASRLDRSLDVARLFVDELDRRALSLKTRVTRSLAAEVLRAVTGEEEATGEGT